MRVVLSLGILLLVINGCGNSNKIQLLEVFEEPCDKYFFGVRETQLVSTNAFEINIPLNWYYTIEESKDGNTTYVFSEKLDTTNNLDLTDIEFYDKYNNFETISLAFSEVNPKMNYLKSYEIAMQKLKQDSSISILSTGEASYQNRTVNWTVTNDRNYEADGIRCQAFISCVYNEEYYVWIMQQTLGDIEVQARKCEAINILKTMKLKVHR